MRTYQRHNPRLASFQFFVTTGQRGRGLSGAVFTLFNGENEIASATSGRDGRICFASVRPGSYRLVETAIPSGYVPEQRIFSVNVEACGRVFICGRPLGLFRVHNVPVPVPAPAPTPVQAAGTSFTFLEYDTLSGCRLDGAVFRLEDELSYLEETESREGGHVTFRNVVPGSYVLKELTAPFGYQALSRVWQVEVGEDLTIAIDGIPLEKFSLGNLPCTFEFPIHKTGAASGLPLAGAIFQLSLNGTPIRVGTTDQLGCLTFVKLYAGSYILRELQPPAGYNSNPVEYQVDIAMDGRIQVDGRFTGILEIANTMILFDAAFTKTDVFGEPLAAAVFSLSQGGDTVTSAVSDENGRISFGQLCAGTYTLTEQSPPPGFLTDNGKYRVLVAEDGTVTIEGTPAEEFRVVNDRPGQLLLYKINEAGEPLGGSVYLMTGPTGIISAMTTDEDGTAVQSNLAIGSHELKESVPPHGYGLNPHIYELCVEEDGRVLIDGFSSGKITAVNEPARYSVLFEKAEETTFRPVEGAEFELKGQQGTAYAASDAGGRVLFERVPIGTYNLREIAASAGYFQDNRTFSVTVGTEGVVMIDMVPQERFRILNRPYPDLVIVKQSARERPLAGAVIELVKDGNSVGTMVTGADGIVVLEHLTTGTYELKESAAPLGYGTDGRIRQVVVCEDGRLTVDGAVFTDPYVWENGPAPNSLLVYKVDGSDRSPLPEAVYQLLSDNGFRETAMSDAAGRIYFSNLGPGYYVLQEIQAPMGYQLDESYYRVTVDDIGIAYVVGQLSGNVTIRDYRLMDIQGRTIWEDNGNQKGFRPPCVTITLFRDGVSAFQMELPSDEEEFVFAGLPQYSPQQRPYQYTVGEQGMIPGYVTSVDQACYTILHTFEELTVTIQAVEIRTGTIFDSRQLCVPAGAAYTAYANKYAGYTLMSQSPVELTNIYMNQLVSFYYVYDMRAAQLLL